MKSSHILSLAAIGLFTAWSALAHDGHDHATTAAADKYPLTTCIVSGDKLGEMGEPVTYVYKQAGQPDRVLQFCCKDCIKDFEKEPAKYLAKYDAAVKGAAIATTAPADAKTGSMAGCCASGNQACCDVVKNYLPIADALAADDLAKAKEAAATLAKQADAGGMKAVYEPALAVVHAGDLKAARAAFKTLSAQVVPLVENDKSFVVMNCPMANADWIQTDTKVRNPYYGKMMLTCGSPKK